MDVKSSFFNTGRRYQEQYKETVQEETWRNRLDDQLDKTGGSQKGTLKDGLRKITQILLSL